MANSLFTKRKNMGFTLAELLFVIAIVAILAGIGFIGVNSYIRNNRQYASDKAAETIAMAFQNRLQEVYAFGDITEAELESGSVNAVVTDPTGTIQVYVIGMENGAAVIGNETAKDTLTYFGQIFSADFYENGIILEYDPVNCRVISVTYVSNIDDYDVSSLYSQIADIRDPDKRKSIYQGYVGYYEMEELNAAQQVKNPEALIKSDVTNQIHVRVGRYVNGERRLYNYDKLIADIEIAFPTGGPNYSNKLRNKTVLIRIEIEGETSKNKVIFAEWGPYMDTMGYTYIPMVLDGLGINENNGRCESFAGQFSENGVLPTAEEVFKTVMWHSEGRQAVRVDQNGSELGNPHLIPGENITVSVYVGSYASYSGAGAISGTALLSATTSASDNSLFAYDNEIYTESGNIKSGVSGNYYNAIIAYGRHLQNLDETSGLVSAIKTGKLGTGPESLAVKATQISDIDFSNPLDPSEDEERNVVPIKGRLELWYDCYTTASGSEKESLYFTPILNEYIVSYDTFNKYEEGTPLRILNLKIDESKLEKSAVKVLNSENTAAVPRSYLDKSSYKVTVNGNVVYDRYCAGLFRVFWGSEIKNLTLVDPQITGIAKVGADGEEDNVVSACGSLAGIMVNDATVTNCQVLITGKETVGTGDDAEEIPTGFVTTVPETDIH